MNGRPQAIYYPAIMINIGVVLLCALFALYLVSEAWIGAAVLASLLPVLASLIIDKRILAIIWITGIPTLFVFANNVMDVLPFITADRLLFVMLVGLLLLGRGFKTIPEMPFNRLEKAMLLYLFWQVLNFLASIGGKEIDVLRGDLAFFVQALIMPLGAYFIARRLDWQEKHIEWMLGAFVVVGLFLSLIGALEYFLGLKWFVPTYKDVIHTGRATGTFGNAVEFGNVVIITLLLTVLVFVRCQNALMKSILLLCLGCSIVALVICLTRSPLVAFAACIPFLLFVDARIRPLVYSGAILIAVAAPIVAPIFLDLDALMHRFTDLTSIYNRLALWATASNIVIDNPLFGVDFGRSGFIDAKDNYYASFGSVSAYYAKGAGVPHMEYLHVAVLSGVVGLLLLLNVFLQVWRHLTDLRCSNDYSPLCSDLAIYVSAIFITYVVSGFFVDILLNTYFPILVYFLVGLAASQEPTTCDQQSNSKI